VPPIFFYARAPKKIGSPAARKRRRYRSGLDPRQSGCPANVFSTGERFNFREFIMTISYRILNSYAYPVIEFGGQVYGEEDLCDTIWLVQKELRHGLPRKERIEAQRQIAEYQTLLDALRAGGA
jgi:hypothetical protein